MLWFAGSLYPQFGAAPNQALMLGILMVHGMALSLINGMLYKIVPFLSWFHLQNRQMH